jgi:hypothetical protein
VKTGKSLPHNGGSQPVKQSPARVRRFMQTPSTMIVLFILPVMTGRMGSKIDDQSHKNEQPLGKYDYG